MYQLYVCFTDNTPSEFSNPLGHSILLVHYSITKIIMLNTEMGEWVRDRGPSKRNRESSHLYYLQHFICFDCSEGNAHISNPCQNNTVYLNIRIVDVFPYSVYVKVFLTGLRKDTICPHQTIPVFTIEFYRHTTSLNEVVSSEGTGMEERGTGADKVTNIPTVPELPVQ